MFPITKSSVSRSDILANVRDEDILAFYFNIKELPCLINSPFRKDENPSFVFFTGNSGDVLFKDLANGDSGNIWVALGKLWSTDEYTVLQKVYSDIKDNRLKTTVFNGKVTRKLQRDRKHKSHIDVTVREWRDYDIEYWASYGIKKSWLDYAEIYPISHIFVNNSKGSFRFPADKYAYVYIERKEGLITKKVYQPMNKLGFKWFSDNDKTVIALWTKVPQYGDKICICSSVKDALCLWANTNIPSIAIQGEGFPISEHAICDLKSRYKDIFILLDNDKPGLENANKLSLATGFKNIVLPQFDGGKDISDFYKSCQDKTIFTKTMIDIIK